MTQPEWTTPPTQSPAAPAYGPAAPVSPAQPMSPAPSMPDFGTGPALTSGPALVPAPLLSRLVAFLVDFGGTVVLTSTVAFACIAAGLGGFFGSGSGSGSTASSALAFLGFVAIFVIPLGSIVLNVLLTRTRMYSVGQALMRIRLVDARTGGAAGVGTIIARMLLLIVPGIATVALVAVVVRSVLDGVSLPGPSIATIFFPVILALTIIPMMRGDRRGWQDRATNQAVVKAAPRL
jgi:hypothetical protein